MSIGAGEDSRIYSTSDGGLYWTLVYTNPEPDGLFYGMAFSDSRNGFLYGEASAGKPLVARTQDGGTTWQRIDPDRLPSLLEGEGGLPGGSGIVTTGERVWIATNGAQSRVLYSFDGGDSWQASETPIAAGPSWGVSGIFSLALEGNELLVAAGGSFHNPQQAGDNLALSRDGTSWNPLQADPPLGLISSIAFLPGSAGQILVATGASGSNYSIDGGAHWQKFEEVGFNPENSSLVCCRAACIRADCVTRPRTARQSA